MDPIRRSGRRHRARQSGLRGHGGHAGGDEFTEQEHILLLDGDTLKAWTPWRTDCGAYRRFNPTSGFWPSTYVVRGDTLEERVASSDLSRSNWCPGDDVQPLRLALGDRVRVELSPYDLTRGRLTYRL